MVNKDYSKIENDKLEKLLTRKNNKYHKLLNSPKERLSAYKDIPIHSRSILQQTENLYDEMMFIKAEISKRKNKDAGEQLWFIYSADLWKIVTPFITENGIMKSGGYLDSYFIGKSEEDHLDYVTGRHGKVVFKFDFLEKEINFVSDKSDENRIMFKALIGDREIKVKTKFKIDHNHATYFYFGYSDLKIKSVSEKQINEATKKVAKYAAAYLYKMTYAKEKSINIADL